MRVHYDVGNLKIGVDGLDTVADALGDLRSKTPAVTKVALNRTARQARQLMVQKAQVRYAINAQGQRALRKLEMKGKGHKATNSNLDAVLYIKSVRNDLGYFQFRPTGTFTGRRVSAAAPGLVTARVLKESQMKPLTGTGGLSKGFAVEFASGHVGMVQRVIGSSSEHTVTQRSGAQRWTNREGNVEKLQTMGSPSATAMHNVVWPMVEPEVETLLQENLEAQVQKVLARAAAKGK